MNQITAKHMWNNATTEPVSDDNYKFTTLGSMMIPLGIPINIPISYNTWKMVSGFLREWANAIDGEIDGIKE